MKVFGAGAFALLILLTALPAEAAGRVESVTAHTTARSNLPPLVAERMNRSVGAIASQLLEGKEIDAVKVGQNHYEDLIHEVFDKVLVGYTVRRVEIDPAVQAQVRVELLPWSETIQTIRVETNVEGMPPRVERLVRQDVAGVETVFQDALTGLPTAAADWTNGILKQHLNSWLEKRLPEFRADFDLDPETETQVRLTLYPRLPVVRTVDLSMRSDTVPNSALIMHREFMQEQVNDIAGVPVGFIRRHRAELERDFAQGLDAAQDFRLLHMRTKVEISAAERAAVMSRSDTDRYRLRLSGWLDVGRNRSKEHEAAKNLLFRLHAGRMLGRQDEFFTLVEFMPENVRWGYQLGWQHDFPGGRQMALRYDLRKGKFIYGVAQKIASRWLLRYEYRVADSMGEAALRYRLHDFMSVEYIFDNEQNWLRFIGNF